MPPGFPPGGFSYIYFFYYVWWGGEVWFAAARGAWRVGGCCAALAKSWSAWRNFGRDFAAERRFDGGAVLVAARGAWRGRATRWRVGGYGWCGSAELLRYTGERGIMGAAAHPNTKNPTGRRGSFYSFL